MKTILVHQYTEKFAVRVRLRHDGQCELLLPNMLETIIVRSEADIEIGLATPLMMQVKIVMEVK